MFCLSSLSAGTVLLLSGGRLGLLSYLESLGDASLRQRTGVGETASLGTGIKTWRHYETKICMRVRHRDAGAFSRLQQRRPTEGATESCRSEAKGAPGSRAGTARAAQARSA